MKPTTTLLLCVAIALTSCKKDSDAPCVPEPVPASLDVSAFSQLDSGNYWVYDRRRVDSLDVLVDNFYARDSLRVVGDTVLNGHTYAVIHYSVNGAFNPSSGFRFWRDSADHIVDQIGMSHFAAATFDQDIYIDSIPVPNNLAIHYAVASTTVPITVPTGGYNAYVVTGTCYSYGSFPIIPVWKYPRTYWVEGIGRVKWYGYFASGSWGYRYELADYSVQ